MAIGSEPTLAPSQCGQTERGATQSDRGSLDRAARAVPRLAQARCRPSTDEERGLRGSDRNAHLAPHLDILSCTDRSGSGGALQPRIALHRDRAHAIGADARDDRAGVRAAPAAAG